MMKNKGYTLIELIVVLSIIAILSAMAIPGFRGMKDRANIFAAKESLNNLRLAEALYKQDRDRYTATLSDLYKYGNITQQLRHLSTTPSITVFTSADYLLSVFTIQSRARDRNSTVVTGNVQRVWSWRD